MSRRVRASILLLPMVLLLLGGCSAKKILFVYPDEEPDMSLRITRTPMLYIDIVADLRPVEQREGQGKFFGITYPKDKAWSRPATEIYAAALAQDLEQTQLMELVPLQSQAQYVLSAELLSMSNRLERSPSSMLLAASIGGIIGVATGNDMSHRIKLGIALGVLTALAVPVSTHHRAEAEVRLTLRDDAGNVLWRKSCLGEVEDKTWMPITARSDQKLVDEYLTRAVKKCNGCLLGQLRPVLLELAAK